MLMLEPASILTLESFRRLPPIVHKGNPGEGVFFVTDQNYSVGTEVLLSFPYSRPGDIEQEGCVVRVDERADGRRGVAIALGEAAAAARALDVSSEERQRQRVVALADMTAEAPPRPSVVEQTAEVSDLKLLDREREEARRLTDELADLKVSYAHAARERDRLASEESDRNLQLRELTSARDEMSRLAEELKQQVQELQEKLAAAERELAQQAELAGRAQQETARAADLKTELDQAQKEVGTLKGLQARIQEFQKDGVGPLTNLAAHCDLFAMNKSLDADARKMGKEISQQAGQLRKAFYKLTQKS